METKESLMVGMWSESVTEGDGFAVGDVVTAVSFVDCFGKRVERTDGLVVESMQRIAGNHIDPYYRLFAQRPDSRESVEGATRFFTHADPNAALARALRPITTELKPVPKL